MSEKLKIEDMTLGQIKDLKKEISDNIEQYLHDLVKIIDNKYDLGDIDISVRTDVYDFEFNCCDPIKAIEFKTSIKFSKEDL